LSELKDETDPYIKDVFYRRYLEECGHLQYVAKLLQKYEGKPWQAVYTCGGDFPDLLRFEGNVDYIRGVLKQTVNFTKHNEDYCLVNDLPNNSNFFKYQKMNIKKTDTLPSHQVIKNHIKSFGKDYRYETAKNPVQSLQDRKIDNTTLARTKQK